MVKAKLPAAAIRVAIVLADYCNAYTGRCDPSRETIARDAGLDRSNVTRAIKTLREYGCIAHGEKRNDSTSRSIQWDLLYQCERCHQRTSNGVNSAPQKGVNNAPQKGIKKKVKKRVGSHARAHASPKPVNGDKPDPTQFKFLMYSDWEIETDFLTAIEGQFMPNLGTDLFWRQVERFIDHHVKKETVATQARFQNLLAGWMKRANDNLGE